MPLKRKPAHHKAAQTQGTPLRTQGEMYFQPWRGRCAAVPAALRRLGAAAG